MRKRTVPLEDARLAVENFEAITIEEPSTVIINQIRAFLADGTLRPGTRLPSERELAERFGVGRGHIRKALAKLEFYGILKTLPQKGTIVASIGVRAIEGLLANMLELSKPDVHSLLETRAILEIGSAALAAERGSVQEGIALEACLEEYRRKAAQGLPTLEEDHLFHLKLATMSKNSTLLSLISLITPDIIAMNRNFKERDGERFRMTIEEHEAIVRAVVARDPVAARAAMERHMAESARRRLPA
jgi:GntR family transcriptional repressor for pyruvate dehydrogenase complex